MVVVSQCLKWGLNHNLILLQRTLHSRADLLCAYLLIPSRVEVFSPILCVLLLKLCRVSWHCGGEVCPQWKLSDSERFSALTEVSLFLWISLWNLQSGRLKRQVELMLLWAGGEIQPRPTEVVMVEFVWKEDSSDKGGCSLNTGGKITAIGFVSRSCAQ